jgi:hypothetical protein
MPGRESRARGLTLASACVLIAVMAACARTASSPEALPGPVPDRLGSIAVVALPAGAPLELQTPAKGQSGGAWSGAGQGAWGSVAVGLRAGLLSGHPIGFLTLTALGVALAPVAAITGGVMGASNAYPEREVSAAEAVLRRTLTQADPAGAVRERVASIAGTTTPRELTGRPQLAQGHGYSDLRGDGFDTALEILVVHLGLLGQGKIDPSLGLRLAVRGRLVSLDSFASRYERTWTYSGARRGFFAWAEDDARLLRAELERAYREIAVDVVSDLFLTPAPARPDGWAHRAWPEGAGQSARDRQVFLDGLKRRPGALRRSLQAYLRATGDGYPAPEVLDVMSTEPVGATGCGYLLKITYRYRPADGGAGWIDTRTFVVAPSGPAIVGPAEQVAPRRQPGDKLRLAPPRGKPIVWSPATANCTAWY